MKSECSEFRHGLDNASSCSDEFLSRHIEHCSDCAIYLDRRLRKTPAGLRQPALEPLPPSLENTIFQNMPPRSIRPEEAIADAASRYQNSDYLHTIMAGLSGLALAAALFLLAIRTAPLPVISLPDRPQVQYSFLESEGKHVFDYGFIETLPEKDFFVTDETDSDSNNWTFLEPSPNFSFLENDKEALWEDQSNG